MTRSSARHQTHHDMIKKTSVSPTSAHIKVHQQAKKIKKRRNVRRGNCFNCRCDETETDLWRSDIFAPPGVKQMVCNACGLWSRDHGEYRPPHMFKHLKARAQKEIKHGASAAGMPSHPHSRAPSPRPGQASSSVSATSTPLSAPSPLTVSEVSTPSLSPQPPSSRIHAPVSSLSSSSRKDNHDDDIVAASTLLAMFQGHSEIHDSPPPLGSSTSFRSTSFNYHPMVPERPEELRSYSTNLYTHSHSISRQQPQHYHYHSDSLDYSGPSPSCRLFDSARTSNHVPSWMGQQRATILPTTPTQATYGRCRPSETSIPSTNTTPTISRQPLVPTYSRPSLTNLCNTHPSDRQSSPDSSSFSSVPPLVYHATRRGSSAESNASFASSALSSMLASPTVEHRPLRFMGDEPSYFPDMGNLKLK